MIWPDSTHKKVDTVIWCTGFKPALHHFNNLNIFNDKEKIDVKQCHSIKEPDLWLIRIIHQEILASSKLRIGLFFISYFIYNMICITAYWLRE